MFMKGAAWRAATSTVAFARRSSISDRCSTSPRRPSSWCSSRSRPERRVLRVEGDCPDCDMSAANMIEGIAAHLRARVPEVKDVRRIER